MASYNMCFNEIRKNGSGCYDPTAYKAILNVEEKKEMDSYNGDISRGDIFYIKHIGGINERSEGRPGVVVSNNNLNKKADYVTVVYLSGKALSDLPTHAKVLAKAPSIALCEQVYTVKKERILEYIRSCTDEEMTDIEKCIAYSFGLDGLTNAMKFKAETEQTIAKSYEELVQKIEMERDLYKQLHNDLLERIIKAK